MKCPICNRTLKDKNNLAKHIKKLHPSAWAYGDKKLDKMFRGYMIK